MSSPLVSVVMSAWNEERYVGKTIESILSQTFTDFEFIIVNDGSTDKTQHVLDDFASRDKRIKIIVNEANIGMAQSLNRGIENAQGDYLARIDAADTAHPSRLEKQVRFLYDNPEIYIVGTYAYWIDEDGKTIGEWRVPEVIEYGKLFKSQIAIHPSIMTKRELFKKIGLYTVKYDISLEFDLYLRASKYRLGIANVPEFLTCVMSRDQGLTQTNLRTTQWHQFKIKMAYLPHFFSFWNVLSTIRSFVGLLLPSFLLKRIVRKSIRGEHSLYDTIR